MEAIRKLRHLLVKELTDSLQVIREDDSVLLVNMPAQLIGSGAGSGRVAVLYGQC